MTINYLTVAVSVVALFALSAALDRIVFGPMPRPFPAPRGDDP